MAHDRRPRRYPAMTGDEFTRLLTDWRELPAKAPDDDRILRTSAVVKEALPDIDKLRGRGYSIDEIARLLTDRGFDISPASLRDAIARERRKTAPQVAMKKGQHSATSRTHSRIRAEDLAKQAGLSPPSAGMSHSEIRALARQISDVTAAETHSNPILDDDL